MGRLTPRQAFSLYARENPYQSAAALAHSNYSMYHNGELERLLDWREPRSQARLAHNSFRAFIMSSDFSCVGGKAAVQTGSYRFGFYEKLSDSEMTEGLARDLSAFISERSAMPGHYKSFVAAFNDRPADEAEFESKLWLQLQLLHELDRQQSPWHPLVSQDPEEPTFAFSFGGAAFFIVGLHPKASRFSRRFVQAALVFNPHEQFRRLRSAGRFQRIQREVRAREMTLQGSLNPNLSEFGEASEARQYAGRAVEQDWRCPFKAD